MTPRINISIDDVSPHPMASIRVIEQCYRVLDHFPDAKFTLFIPIAYWRTMGETATDIALNIDEFPGFCDFLRSLPTNNFELCYHGLHHGIPGKSNNDELQRVSHQDALGIFDEMLRIVTNAGLRDAFKMILRPPAWRMCPEAFKAAIDIGFHTFALSPDAYAKAVYAGADGNIPGNRVVYYNVCPPQKPLQLFDMTEIVYHACEWDKNYLSPEACDDLVTFLRQHEVEFVFIEGLIG